MATLELYGSSQCALHAGAARMVGVDAARFPGVRRGGRSQALARMRALDCGVRTVPVLVENGKVIQVGWQGRGCILRSE